MPKIIDERPANNADQAKGFINKAVKLPAHLHDGLECVWASE